MRLQTDNQQLREFYREELIGDHYDPPGIEFYDSGISQEVVQEVAEAVADAVDGISLYDPDTKSGDNE
ncbi:hypothetical protein [Natrinema ejinorense]|uniref:Uncharacterized protein n=1 Tax=Natrinema ejinorense TaxID=373386 RepID=A0A2A5QR79_9EURY|nr:hypothetical protein [Natrinema ejinorense]PCR89322.1 hypothetical protein CP557_01475 [Natrinema ejinorense]